MAFAKYGERLFGGGSSGSHPQIAYCTVLDFQDGSAAPLFNLGNLGISAGRFDLTIAWLRVANSS